MPSTCHIVGKPNTFKTKLCCYHQNGYCRFGKNCRFAHTGKELRPLTPKQEKQQLKISKLTPNCDYAIHDEIFYHECDKFVEEIERLYSDHPQSKLNLKGEEKRIYFLQRQRSLQIYQKMEQIWKLRDEIQQIIS